MSYRNFTIIISVVFCLNVWAKSVVRQPIPAAQIPKLIKDLDSKDLRIRCIAATNLDYTENPAEVKKHTSKFITLAQSGDQCVKGAAIETLSKIDPLNKEGLDTAYTLLNEGDSGLHWRAANAVIAFVCAMKHTVPLADVKEKYLKYKTKPEVGTRLLRGIACYGYDAFPIVKNELSSADRFIQAEAIQLLASMIRQSSRAEEKKEILNSLKQTEPHSDNVNLLKSNIKLYSL